MCLSPVNLVDVLVLLNALEWSGSDGCGFACCPMCRAGDPLSSPVAREEEETPHEPGCLLAQMIDDLSGCGSPVQWQHRH